MTGQGEGLPTGIKATGTERVCSQKDTTEHVCSQKNTTSTGMISKAFSCIYLSLIQSSGELFSLLKLPAEIRNNIIRLVIAPGPIYIHSRLATDDDIPPNFIQLEREYEEETGQYNNGDIGLNDYEQIAIESEEKKEQYIINIGFLQEDVALLLTCRQVFDEGYLLFKTLHSQAYFICPWGTLGKTETTIKNMTLGQRSHVRLASLHLSEADWEPTIFELLGLQAEEGTDIIFDNAETNDVLTSLPDTIRRHWYVKIRLLRESFPSLEILYLVKERRGLDGCWRRVQYAMFLEGAARTQLMDPRVIAYEDWGSRDPTDDDEVHKLVELDMDMTTATASENMYSVILPIPEYGTAEERLPGKWQTRLSGRKNLCG